MKQHNFSHLKDLNLFFFLFSALLSLFPSRGLFIVDCVNPLWVGGLQKRHFLICAPDARVFFNEKSTRVFVNGRVNFFLPFFFFPSFFFIARPLQLHTTRIYKEKIIINNQESAEQNTWNDTSSDARIQSARCPLLIFFFFFCFFFCVSLVPYAHRRNDG